MSPAQNDNPNNLPVLLLVDDDDTFRAVMARAMTRRGYAVLEAADAATALALAKAEGPEYVLLDLKLANDSGLPLIEQLLALDAETCIVVLTGYASIATAVEAIKLGAIHYLAKPADADQVVAAFHQRAGDAAVPLAVDPLSVDRLEWEHIQRVLAEHDGNISATARALKMHRRTLQRKLGKRPVRA
ncbi:MAG: response regulator transcription factor [Rhodocyclaceae bacterium]|nr:MAG: response regulator transcription factor [Rhodocyclaceae bacterium]